MSGRADRDPGSRSRPRPTVRFFAMWLVLLSACACVGGGHLTSPIGSHVAPRSPLGRVACLGEARRWGYSVDAARALCALGRKTPWFRATFTNASASPRYIRCAFTAWNRHGQRLFHGLLPVDVVEYPAGLLLEPHQTRTVDWYFDRHGYPPASRHVHDVARYTSSCTSVRKHAAP